MEKQSKNTLRDELIHYFSISALEDYQTIPFIPFSEAWYKPYSDDSFKKLMVCTNLDKVTEYIDYILTNHKLLIERNVQLECDCVRTVANSLYKCNVNRFYYLELQDKINLLSAMIDSITPKFNEIFNIEHKHWSEYYKIYEPEFEVTIK